VSATEIMFMKNANVSNGDYVNENADKCFMDI